MNPRSIAVLRTLMVVILTIQAFRMGLIVLGGSLDPLFDIVAIASLAGTVLFVLPFAGQRP